MSQSDFQSYFVKWYDIIRYLWLCSCYINIAVGVRFEGFRSIWPLVAIYNLSTSCFERSLRGILYNNHGFPSNILESDKVTLFFGFCKLSEMPFYFELVFEFCEYFRRSIPPPPISLLVIQAWFRPSLIYVCRFTGNHPYCCF